MMWPMSVDHSRALKTNRPYSCAKWAASSGRHWCRCSLSVTPVKPMALACSPSLFGDMSLSIDPTTVWMCMSMIVPIKPLTSLEPVSPSHGPGS